MAKRLRRGGVVLGALGILLGCNAVLGIKEQATREDDAGKGGGDGAGPASVEHCSSDSECVAPNACYTPHCDTVIGACTYALCEAKDRTCAAGVCDTKTFACSDPQPYSFFATRYAVPGVTSGCGPNPEACVAAAFPYLFVGTRDNVVALRTDDLVAKTPTKIEIADLTARPQAIVASGRRVWVIGEVQGVAPPYALAIASIDVPTDPTVPNLSAHTSVVSYPFPTAAAFAAPNGGLFVVYADATQGLPTALLASAPADGASIVAGALGDGGTDGGAPPPGALVMYPASAVPSGATVVAASGARLVLSRGGSVFNLVTAPGTAAATAQPSLALTPAFVPAGGGVSFAAGPDGTVAMALAVDADPPADCNCTAHARLEWLLPNSTASVIDANVFLDPESWPNPQPAGTPGCHQCPAGYFGSPVLATWLDKRSMLTAAPATGGASARVVTNVRAMGRDPTDLNPKRQAATSATDKPPGDFASDRIALTSSNGFGYLVLADDQGNDVSLTIVDHRCDAQ